MSKRARQSTDRRTEGFIFADPSGRRWRQLRTILITASVAALILASVALGPGLISPWSKDVTAATHLVVSEKITETPTVGTGPVQRVLEVQRSGDQVWGSDPETGDKVHQFTEADIRTIGDASHVTYLSGYDVLPARTVSLTFDDGPDPVVTAQLLDVLSSQHVPATFFVIGKDVARYPQIIQRMVSEGHIVGGHTMNHPDLALIPHWRDVYELVSTDRIIRATAGVATKLWRMPYDNGGLADLGPSVNAILSAEKLGYLHAGYDFDTTDWAIDPQSTATAADIPLPDFTSADHITILMHDSGGPDREKTVAYVRDYLIPAAQAHGYTFTTLAASNGALASANVAVTPSWADKATLVLTKALYVWPSYVMFDLFLFSVIITAAVGLLNAVLALVRRRREHRLNALSPTPSSRIPVTVLLAAYNERKVIERTLRAVLASDYPIREVIVVDDGSTDGTASIVDRLMAEDARIRLIQQPNAGKSGALNNGLTAARGDVVVTIDADTIVTPTTVMNLLRRFDRDSEERIGAVAGVVRVGNFRTNLLTRWQALEYVTQIGVDRAAQAVLNAIAIVPGACTAWRREAILEAGGFKTDNLAEDADLALTMHRCGWRVEQDDEAYAFTEAPDTLDDLLKQRVRWTYGIMQAMWKHRRLLFSRRHPGLGFYVYPQYLITQLVPFIFIPMTIVATITALESGGWLEVLAFFGAFIVYQMVMSLLAVKLMDEDLDLLRIVPLYRVIYEPLRAYLLYATVISALKGVRMRWNRVNRTGSVDAGLGLATPQTRSAGPARVALPSWSAQTSASLPRGAR